MEITPEIEQRFLNMLERPKVKMAIRKIVNGTTDVFKKPSKEEVKEYFLSHKRGDSKNFYDYYESCGWTIGKNKKMKKWQSAAAQWIKRQDQWSKQGKIADMEKHQGTARGNKMKERFEQTVENIPIKSEKLLSSFDMPKEQKPARPPRPGSREAKIMENKLIKELDF